MSAYSGGIYPFSRGSGGREELTVSKWKGITQAVRHLMRIFDEKHKAGEILFQDGAVSINDLLFSKNNDEGKSQVMWPHMWR